MKSNQERAPINNDLMQMAAAVGPSLEEIDDCAERWKAANGVDIRASLPEEMSHLGNDSLYLFCLRRRLETYKWLRKKKRRG